MLCVMECCPCAPMAYGLLGLSAAKTVPSGRRHISLKVRSCTCSCTCAVLIVTLPEVLLSMCAAAGLVAVMEADGRRSLPSHGTSCS